MFLGGTTGYDRHAQQRSQGPFLALFSQKPGGEIRACVRRVHMKQLGQFMSGDLVVRSKTALLKNDLGPRPSQNPEYYRPYVRDGSFRIYVEGTYGSNGLTIDLERYPGLWELLHPIPDEIAQMKWKDTQGWNSAGSEGTAMMAWARQNIEMLRRTRGTD